MLSTHRTEFGDFQTPLGLAREITAFLAGCGEAPDAIVEPTCGRGSFLVAAMDAFPQANVLLGFDISPDHVRDARKAVGEPEGRECRIERRDFFQADWAQLFASIPGNLLVIGNPPWVTNSELGALGSANLPTKTNFQGHGGFAAKTGKANFDISEWMLIRLLEALHRRKGCLAMLAKTSVARKALRYAWLNRLRIGRCSLHTVDVAKHFGVSVDACLVIVHTGEEEASQTASVYCGLSFNAMTSMLGLVGEELVADVVEYSRLNDIDGISCYTWRSGVKHDAAATMEFARTGGRLTNGKGEECDLEETYLFPLLKSSDIANGRTVPERLVLLTQRKPSDDTFEIQEKAPKTWAYLSAHADKLDGRRSIIYAKRPRFSVFGIGNYTFSPWKVVISGLYKNSRFGVVGKHHGKPVVLDDTCYFVPCASESEATFVCDLLNSEICQRFLRALAFFDAKRPITIDTLARIDLRRVAERLGRSDEGRKWVQDVDVTQGTQLLLVSEDKRKYRAKGSRQSAAGYHR
jgi:hypothetical protein